MAQDAESVAPVTQTALAAANDLSHLRELIDVSPSNEYSPNDPAQPCAPL